MLFKLGSLWNFVIVVLANSSPSPTLVVESGSHWLEMTDVKVWHGRTIENMRGEIVGAKDLQQSGDPKFQSNSLA